MDLLLYIFVFLPLVQAWTFRYTNPVNGTTTFNGTTSSVCTEIDIANGTGYLWDTEGSGACVYLYSDAECLNSEGMDELCDSRKKPAGGDFHSAIVFFGGTPNNTASTSSSSSSGSSLSGAAIAGIVVGVVCAVLIIAAVFFFGRRRKQKAILANQHNAYQGPYGPNATGDAEADTPASSKGIFEKPADLYSVGVVPAPGSKLTELPGKGLPAELANNPVHELDTPSSR